MNNRLIVCIVPHGRGDLVAGAARDAGAGGGTILMGRGTAANSILTAFYACGSAADAVFCRATATAFDSDGTVKNDRNDTRDISGATACANGRDNVATICTAATSAACAIRCRTATTACATTTCVATRRTDTNPPEGLQAWWWNQTTAESGYRQPACFRRAQAVSAAAATAADGATA